MGGARCRSRFGGVEVLWGWRVARRLDGPEGGRQRRRVLASAGAARSADTLASYHSGAEIYGIGGGKRVFSVVPTISLSVGIVFLRWSPALGRAAACQHRVPS
jgi:hypothetical protein